MAHRMFVDEGAREWLVWDVIPQSADRRDAAEGPSGATIPTDPGLTALDRRATSGPETPRSVARLPGALAEGWLCFESGTEKRRLAPIPHGWDTLPDAELEGLLARAQRATPREAQLDTTRMRALARSQDPRR